jgi:transcription elongation factor Elf1
MRIDGVIERRIHCPFCAEALEIQLDLSAGDQSYIEDCQVCCQPIQLNYAVDDGNLISIDVQCAS